MYNVKVTATIMRIPLYSFLLPIFYFDGELRERFYGIYDGGEIVARPSSEDKWNITLARGGTLYLDIYLNKLNANEIPNTNNLCIRPAPNSVIIRFNCKPDPGEEPPIAPRLVRRYFFKKMKKIVKERSVFISLKRLENVIRERGFKALVHIGGSLFMFTDNPLKFRLPSIPIKWQKEDTIPYTILSKQLIRSLGLAKIVAIACYDIIEDIDRNIYIRFNDPLVCHQIPRDAIKIPLEE